MDTLFIKCLADLRVGFFIAVNLQIKLEYGRYFVIFGQRKQNEQSIRRLQPGYPHRRRPVMERQSFDFMGDYSRLFELVLCDLLFSVSLSEMVL